MKIIIMLCLLLPCAAHADTMSIYYGGSTINSQQDPSSNAWALSYAWALTPHIYTEVGYLNEGHKPEIKRDGIYAAAQFRRHFDDRLSVGATAGAYLSDATVPGACQTGTYIMGASQSAMAETNNCYRDRKRLGPMIGFDVAAKITKTVGVDVRWIHVLFLPNQDADVFLMGVEIN